MVWPASLDEYQKLVIRMNTPRVVIDNAVCATATLVKVDSARKDGILLEAVQVLTDLDLSIKKAYISSDGRWFMDVFHVTDRYGEKLADDRVISDIERSLGASDEAAVVSVGMDPLTTLELTGADRPGLLSEVFAVLSDLHCIVAEAKLWTHNGRIAALIFVKEEDSGLRIEDSEKIRRIEARLRNVVRGATTAVSSSAITSSSGGTYVDRRLHQMMFADRDYERGNSGVSETSVSVQNWTERGYSIVNVQCRDRPKLLFDVICTLTDMEYVVFHGTINTTGDRACQEFCIRHSDGSPISSEAERQRVIQCLQAAIDRRASEGLRLELCATNDRSGLLAEATRTFRENGLSVTRAEVSTKGDMALNMFYVTDAAGHPIDRKTIDAVIERVGAGRLKVYEDQSNQTKHMQPNSAQEESSIAGAGLLYLGSLVRKNLYNLGLIRSCS